MFTLPVEELKSHLKELFGLKELQSILPLERGFMSYNYKVNADHQTFFLKQYRYRPCPSIHDVKYAEQFLAERDIPVLMAVADRFGRHAFYMDAHWYSLFPYTEGRTLGPDELKTSHTELLGELLGKMHKVGLRPKGHLMPRVRFWNPVQFQSEVVEVERAMKRKEHPTPVQQQTLKLIRSKQSYLHTFGRTPSDFDLTYDTLLHGDFIYQNVFFDQEEKHITHVFDFEKAALGPRAYELARSLLISCFDDGLEDRNFDLAEAFFRAYSAVYPISKHEFIEGLALYATHFMHTTWPEVRVIVEESRYHEVIIARSMNRIQLLKDGGSGFIERLFPIDD